LKENYEVTEWQGFLKHAIILCFYFLLRYDVCPEAEKKEFYYKAIRYTI